MSDSRYKWLITFIAQIVNNLCPLITVENDTISCNWEVFVSKLFLYAYSFGRSQISNKTKHNYLKKKV